MNFRALFRKAKAVVWARRNDRASGGDFALLVIVSALARGTETQQARELIRSLKASEVVLTEDIFIVHALKSLEQSNCPLTLETLRAQVATEDPAGFVRCVLDQISNRCLPADALPSAFTKAWLRLEETRELNAKRLVLAKRTAVEVAEKILMHRVSLAKGAETLQSMACEFSPKDSATFAIFERITAQLRDHPKLEQRHLWAADALARKDRERADVEAKSREEAEQACRQIIERWRNE